MMIVVWVVCMATAKHLATSATEESQKRIMRVT